MLCLLRRVDHSSRGVLPSVVRLTGCDREASLMRRPWPTGCCRDAIKRLKRYRAAVNNVSYRACRYSCYSTCIWKVRDFNLGRPVGYPEVFHSFLQHLYANYRLLPQNRPRRIPFQLLYFLSLNDCLLQCSITCAVDNSLIT